MNGSYYDLNLAESLDCIKNYNKEVIKEAIGEFEKEQAQSEKQVALGVLKTLWARKQSLMKKLEPLEKELDKITEQLDELMGKE